jgi:hypothetical protein
MTWIAVALTVAGAIPLAFVLWVRPPVPYWLLGAGLSASWVGDLMMYRSGGAWDVAYLWLPLQFGLVLMGLARTMRDRAIILFCVPALGIFSAYLSGPRPDMALTLIGSLAVLYLAEGRATLALYVYFGLGTVLYFLMAARAGTPEILLPWAAYQACRVIAYAAFGRAVYQAARS